MGREVRVLANGCPEGAAMVRAEFPGVALLETPRNVGSAPGRNLAAGRGQKTAFGQVRTDLPEIVD